MRQRFEDRLAHAGREKILDWMLTSIEGRFTTRLEELRESAAATGSRAERVPKPVKDARERLSKPARHKVEAAVDSFLESVVSATQTETENLALGERDEPPRVIFHTEATAVVPLMLLGPDRLAEIASALENSVQSWEELSLAMAYLAWRSSQDTPSAVLDACIPSLVIEFEDLLSALLRIAQLIHPDGLGAGRKLISLDEVDARGGAEMARIWAIDRASRDLVDKGADEWRNRLQKWPGVDPARFVPSWDAFAEVFHRRNVLTHSAARADEKYLTLADPTNSRRLGDPLHCDLDYVLSAIDTFLAAGRGIAAVWLPALLPQSGFELHGADEVVLVMLRRERWELAASLSSALLASAPSTSHTLRVNHWMARRELAGSTDVIRSEVSDWLPPNDQTEWRLARAAVMEDVEEVKETLRLAKRRGDPVTHYLTWPLLRRLRRKDLALDRWLSQNVKKR